MNALDHEHRLADLGKRADDKRREQIMLAGRLSVAEADAHDAAGEYAVAVAAANKELGTSRSARMRIPELAPGRSAWSLVRDMAKDLDLRVEYSGRRDAVNVVDLRS